VISLSQSAALALISKGIRVNAIAPGVVDTPMWAKVDATFVRQHGLRPGEKTEQVRSAIPYGRLADPREIAAAAESDDRFAGVEGCFDLLYRSDEKRWASGRQQQWIQ
jgi:NAD(P)-dependent dehydrogenase (short-subunit alcohol dehydrogenase family)